MRIQKKTRLNYNMYIIYYILYNTDRYMYT